ncbi:carbon-nitrogen hydrolase [Podospora didyma]|uniref:Carbon-nitrogen hydrolase n=1 Tax=Podospora didyma TaxID=330526 RepID=A0AAE0NBX0_9PEZI|nr:carbon-nitrogen hydrolase [Podospora didyma]
MRIGCLQFAPKVGDVSNNLNRADAVLAKADAMELDNLDLLVLPEMAFSGYNFKSAQDIMPFLEPSGSGISSLWARTTALKYDCTVAVGYPEKVDSSRRHRQRAAPEYYNSLILVNGDGETVANYRKSFLYDTDTTWAQEGQGFYGAEVDEFGKVAMGICMDINPYKFQAPWHAFEFAFHILEVNANLVILSMAWLTHEDRATFTPFSQEPDMETLTYWAQRLEPVIRSENEDEIIVVFCNRCGIEDDVVYAGTSAVLGIKNGEVSVYGLLGRGVKDLLVVNTELPPFAKLVNRPELAPADAESEASSKKERRPSESDRSESPAHRTHPSTGNAASPGISSRGRTLPPSSSTMTQKEPEPKAQEALDTCVSPCSMEPSPCDACSECDEPYKGCEGGCGGCEEHASTDELEFPETPKCPSPTPASERPKLAISTGPQSLPPPTTKNLPTGMEPGNFFTSRDLCTPPFTPFDDFPMSANEYYRFPPSAFPKTSKMHTPEEPIWPVYGGSTKIDFKKMPSRASRMEEAIVPPTRPESPKSRNTSKERPAAESPRSRNASKTRATEGSSPVTSSRSRTWPIEQTPSTTESQSTHSQRTAGSIAETQSPAERNTNQSRPTQDSKLSRVKQTIPIAASPSVFKTSFSQVEVAPAIQRPSSRMAHHGLRRSKSISNTIPLFQYQAPPIPQTPLVKSFSSSRSLSRGRQAGKREPSPAARSSRTNNNTSATPSTAAQSLHPDIKALMITEDEAFLGRTITRPENRRGRQAARGRRRSIDPKEAELYSPMDIKSPISV